jgi:DNA-binding XRE family transcriptional regulator
LYYKEIQRLLGYRVRVVGNGLRTIPHPTERHRVRSVQACLPLCYLDVEKIVERRTGKFMARHRLVGVSLWPLAAALQRIRRGSSQKAREPAVEYSRIALARNPIRDCVEAGLSQRQLAELAGVRVETICRLEAGKHVPGVPTVDKLDRTLKRHAKSQCKRGTTQGQH